MEPEPWLSQAPASQREIDKLSGRTEAKGLDRHFLRVPLVRSSWRGRPRSFCPRQGDSPANAKQIVEGNTVQPLASVAAGELVDLSFL